MRGATFAFERAKSDHHAWYAKQELYYDENRSASYHCHILRPQGATYIPPPSPSRQQKLRWLASCQHSLNTVVSNNHHGPTNTAGQLRNHSLVHALHPFVLQDLSSTIKR